MTTKSDRTPEQWAEFCARKVMGWKRVYPHLGDVAAYRAARDAGRKDDAN